MEQNETSTNRCRRCNRQLKNPYAQYGWRCAEILGITQNLNYAGDGTFNAYMQAMKAADNFLRKNNIDPKEIDIKKFFESYVKQYLAAGMNDDHMFAIAYEDMQNALSPKRSERGNLIATPAKTPSIADMMNARDRVDYWNGKYTTTTFTNNSFNKKVYELQQELNAHGATDRFGNPIKEDGVFGPRTQWALEAEQALGDIGKGLVAHSALTKYGVYHTGGSTKFGIIDKTQGRLKNGKPVGAPVLRIDKPHKKAPMPHINLSEGEINHIKIPEWTLNLAKHGNDIVELAKIGGKALAFGGAVADVYELGSTIYLDLNDEDKKLGKKTLQTAAGIGGSYAGGYGGAKIGGMGGSALGTMICPGLGTIIGGILGSIGGGIFGAISGRELGEYIVNKTYKEE